MTGGSLIKARNICGEGIDDTMNRELMRLICENYVRRMKAIMLQCVYLLLFEGLKLLPPAVAPAVALLAPILLANPCLYYGRSTGSPKLCTNLRASNNNSFVADTHQKRQGTLRLTCALLYYYYFLFFFFIVKKNLLERDGKCQNNLIKLKFKIVVL